jgi:hypothetical protein
MDAESYGIENRESQMKKKPDLLLLVFVVFGVGIAVNALGQAIGL